MSPMMAGSFLRAYLHRDWNLGESRLFSVWKQCWLWRHQPHVRRRQMQHPTRRISCRKPPQRHHGFTLSPRIPRSDQIFHGMPILRWLNKALNMYGQVTCFRSTSHNKCRLSHPLIQSCSTRQHAHAIRLPLPLLFAEWVAFPVLIFTASPPLHAPFLLLQMVSPAVSL